MKKSSLISLILLLTFAANTPVGYGQQTSPANASPATSGPDAHALKIRHRLEFLGFGRDVTVRLRHGKDFHGRIVDAGDTSFRIDEVDQRQVIAINYSDTKRIDEGYMEKSLIGNTRRNPHTSRIIAIAAIAGLAVVLGVAIHGTR